MFERLIHASCAIRHGLETWLAPTVLVLFRIWVGIAFWRAGMAKFDDPTGTQFLFHVSYQVPLLAPDLAAHIATWVELIVPWLLFLGIAGRLVALFLFVYNAIAVISYPALWPHGFWHGLFGTAAFADHKIWALMLLAVIVWGAGRWSLDGLIEAGMRHGRRRAREARLESPINRSSA